MAPDCQCRVGAARQKGAEHGMDNLLSVEQAAQRLGVSAWTVYRLARAGRLASICLGRRRLFAAEDLEELIRKTRHSSTSMAMAQG